MQIEALFLDAQFHRALHCSLRSYLQFFKIFMPYYNIMVYDFIVLVNVQLLYHLYHLQLLQQTWQTHLMSSTISFH